MSTYMIAYDLKRSRMNAAYDDISQTIASLGHCWHFLDSAWIVQCDLQAAQICDRLRQYLYGNDELLVVRLGAEADWTGIDPSAVKWLQRHLE